MAGPRYRNNVFQHVLRGGPAGGGYTTVEDLLAFDVALRSGKLVSKEMLEKLWRAYQGKNSLLRCLSCLLGQHLDKVSGPTKSSK